MILKKLQKIKQPLTIFFDVDGVLNKEADWRISFVVNDSCVGALKTLNEKLQHSWDVSYVICSTWRAGISTQGNNSPQFDHLVDVLKQHGINIVGSTPMSNKTRQAEIEYYIKRHNIKDYLILDDDPSLYDTPKDIKLYVPNYKTGLTISDIGAILHILS